MGNTVWAEICVAVAITSGPGWGQETVKVTDTGQNVALWLHCLGGGE